MYLRWLRGFHLCLAYSITVAVLMKNTGSTIWQFSAKANVLGRESVEAFGLIFFSIGGRYGLPHVSFYPLTALVLVHGRLAVLPEFLGDMKTWYGLNRQFKPLCLALPKEHCHVNRGFHVHF